MTLPSELMIDAEFKALIPPLSDEELAGLEASLLAEGCRDSLIAWNGILIDGHNRREICNKHDLPYEVVDREFKDRDAAKVWIIRNQFARRNLMPFQRAELALQLEPLLADAAKANQKAGGAKSSGDGRVVRQKSDKPLDTKKSLAAAAGVSHDTIHKAKVIAAKAPEPVKAKLRRGETTIHKEYKAIVKADRKAKQVADVKSAKLPAGKFHVIAADPPWAYESRADDSTHRAANPYPSMSIDEIKDMEVADRAHDNCVLWLWTTNAFIVQAHSVAAAWGFRVKTILTWAKDRMGTGDWLRGQTEHCLMCVRGNPVVTLTNQTTLLRGPMREHSRKPDSFYELVESLCPGSKCELFSRENREGWTAFGAEVGKFNAAA